MISLYTDTEVFLDVQGFAEPRIRRFSLPKSYNTQIFPTFPLIGGDFINDF